ncbi:putative DCC family thiol-disulfide oxidoreductase YuxK [Nocardiopsis mwathae]|uniref:Putative DCC family thiol-disulfide oxidoreductase YuxK n=1 Tax=Nocardiopsis mwathae TaxID=1472723 RepID=A0A7X0D5E1_9ACTN|nr:DUF393 domain-containing protein [Nocardiopsis mwathae]MBB6171034.1 putative DCC family thiol-disulfide oxidoreductase YuxK [Nocardiopsis mwathae]
MSTPVLVYDGDCAFCSSCVDFALRRVAPGIAAVPFQDGGVTDEQRARAENEVLVLHPDGRRVWGGVDAVAVLLLASPHSAWWPLGALLRTGPVRPVAMAAYRWVAANRHRMPGGTAACRIRPPE